MHVCNMGKYGGLIADALVLGNHVLTGLLPLVPVVQHHILALGDDGIQLLVSEVAVVALDQVENWFLSGRRPKTMVRLVMVFSSVLAPSVTFSSLCPGTTGTRRAWPSSKPANTYISNMHQHSVCS